MNSKAFQNAYPDDLSHCYGCGRLNQHGLQLKSYWDGEETVAHFKPGPQHIAIPGYVYGGLLASLIDCHGIGSAAAATYRQENRTMDSEPALRFVTASLHVDYLQPTPLSMELEIRGKIREVGPRKVIVDATVLAAGILCAQGTIVAVRMPESMVPSTD